MGDASAVITAYLPLIIMIAVPLAFLASFLLLWIYVRAVKRSMRRSTSPAAAVAATPGVEIAVPDGGPPKMPLELSWHHAGGAGFATAARRSLWCHTAVYVIAGLCFALTIGLSYLAGSGLGFDLLVALMLVAFYSWPIVIVVSLVATNSWLGMGLVALSYVAVLAGVVGAAMVDTTVTVDQASLVWWNTNAQATALALAFLVRPIRAVGPLMAALMIAAVAGAIAIALAAGGNEQLLYWAARIGTELNLGPIGAPVALLLTGALLAGLLGWLLLRWLGRLYRLRRISDQSIMIDALLLIFTVEYGTSLAQLGLTLFAAAIGAFVTYKIVAMAGFRLLRGWAVADADAPKLLLLRVFSLGARSERLFGGFAKLWRYEGSIRMIAGPDLATSTVEPHEFLDFLAGRLQRRFIGDRGALDQRLAETEPRRDFDGRFRIANFFCHDDTWRMALGSLAKDSDAVLMDLRGFSQENRGCIFEIEELLEMVPLRRIVFVVDATTDEKLLTQVFFGGWVKVSEASPNCSDPDPRVRLYRLDGSFGRDIPRLVTLLAGADAGQPLPPLGVGVTPVRLP